MDDPAAFRRTESFDRTATAGVLPRPGLELRIGSNVFRRTNGVVTIHGKEQLVIEAKSEQRLLLVTLDLYNEHGTRIAHLRRNVLTLNEGERFAVDVRLGQSLSPADMPSVRLRDLQSGHLVFEARMASDSRVDLICGRLHSHRGIPVEITSHYCRIGSHTTLFREIVEARGGPAILG
ncbi:hypothetical protein [Candidatus Nitrospira nitrificans]|uniref:Uncharacterized protein n=1 Tax=Candidatus Nitrospira nitrificans TaxID=1742973 RepID=A0A0S4LKM0_9BACT|nr:hypothetical protein [Candidatus Nitrospira nitrificans]CUS37306.1 conserved hypothetical protein [Candidatus Nitrospira nitrificans]